MIWQMPSVFSARWTDFIFVPRLLMKRHSNISCFHVQKYNFSYVLFGDYDPPGFGFVLLWCNVQTPDEYQTQPKEKPAQHMFSAVPRSEPRRLLIPAVSMKVRNSLDFLFLLFFVEVPFEVCHGCFTMTCMDVLKRNTVRNIFLSLKSPAIFNLIATAGFIVQPCWQHLSVSHVLLPVFLILTIPALCIWFPV